MTSTPQPSPGGEQTAGAPTPRSPANGQPPQPSPGGEQTAGAPAPRSPAAAQPPPVPRPPAPPAADRPVEPVAELADLATLAERPLPEHVAVLDAVHRALAEQLRGAES